jgi:hypothetical protein
MTIKARNCDGLIEKLDFIDIIFHFKSILVKYNYQTTSNHIQLSKTMNML